MFSFSEPAGKILLTFQKFCFKTPDSQSKLLLFVNEF